MKQRIDCPVIMLTMNICSIYHSMSSGNHNGNSRRGSRTHTSSATFQVNNGDTLSQPRSRTASMSGEGAGPPMSAEEWQQSIEDNQVNRAMMRYNASCFSPCSYHKTTPRSISLKNYKTIFKFFKFLIMQIK